MNAEALRSLTLFQLLDMLDCQVQAAKSSSEGVWRECNPSADPPVPLLTIGDFDIYPRDEVRKKHIH